MGEYAQRNSDGSSIKIGTCEDMYYLRADQVDQVTATCGSIDPQSKAIAERIRFRFPFPGEDDIRPGDFDNYERGVTAHGVEVPEAVEHRKIQFVAGRGILVSLPCPESKEGKESGLPFHYNGYSGKVQVIQQRLVAGALVTVCKCGSCGAAYRLPTLEDAQPIVDAFTQEAETERRYFESGRSHDAKKAEELEMMSARIVAGYTQKNYWDH
jgi:hypothetical protein